jgi:hypothetical protein
MTLSNRICISIPQEHEITAKSMAIKTNRSFSKYVSDAIRYYNLRYTDNPVMGFDVSGSWDDGSPEAQVIRNKLCKEYNGGKDFEDPADNEMKEVKGKEPIAQ